MSAQTPVPKDHPLMVAWQAHKATEQHANDVRWAKVEAHTDGALWSAFEAGWRAREAALSAAGLVVVPREPTPHMVNRGLERADIDWRAASEDEALSDDEVRRIYRAMIAAAFPAAPQEDSDDA